jgi:hypothetical protein
MVRTQRYNAGMNTIDRNQHDGSKWPTAIEVMQWQYPRPIPVSERLPSGDDIVLAFDGDCEEEWGEARYTRKGWVTSYPWSNYDVSTIGVPLEGITHWLPLPPSPEPATPAAERTATEQPADSPLADSGR